MKRGHLTPGSLAHLMLGAATLTPTPPTQLMQRAEMRHGVRTGDSALIGLTARRLAAQGLLHVDRHPQFGRLPHYTITPAGEEELNRLWDRTHGADAA